LLSTAAVATDTPMSELLASIREDAPPPRVLKPGARTHHFSDMRISPQGVEEADEALTHQSKSTGTLAREHGGIDCPVGTTALQLVGLSDEGLLPEGDTFTALWALGQNGTSVHAEREYRVLDAQGGCKYKLMGDALAHDVRSLIDRGDRVRIYLSEASRAVRFGSFLRAGSGMLACHLVVRCRGSARFACALTRDCVAPLQSLIDLDSLFAIEGVEWVIGDFVCNAALLLPGFMSVSPVGPTNSLNLSNPLVRALFYCYMHDYAMQGRYMQRFAEVTPGLGKLREPAAAADEEMEGGEEEGEVEGEVEGGMDVDESFFYTDD
jgi:hypothetical protein